MGGPAIGLLFSLGVGGLFLVMAGSYAVTLASQGNRKQKVLGLFAVEFAAIGLVVGGVAGFLWAPNALRAVAEWSMLGLSFGACFGNVVGRFAWRWLKPENEEVVS
jgi:hypothetical protein